MDRLEGDVFSLLCLRMVCQLAFVLFVLNVFLSSKRVGHLQYFQGLQLPGTNPSFLCLVEGAMEALNTRYKLLYIIELILLIIAHITYCDQFCSSFRDYRQSWQYLNCQSLSPSCYCTTLLIW